jgi:DNA end-binding protein Ku
VNASAFACFQLDSFALSSPTETVNQYAISGMAEFPPSDRIGKSGTRLEGCMAAASWKGFLSFGLITIPIRLSPAARTERISFNQLHKVCHTRIKQPLYCPVCQRNVERNEIEKGYEYEKDQYLLFSEDEIKAMEPDSSQTMEILEFVKMNEVDPLYFDASYYVAPEDVGVRAYHLLVEAMLESGYAGIAKVTMYGRENIVIIRAQKNGLTLHTMFYTNEIRQPAEMGSASDKSAIKDQERTLAKQLIQNLANPFEPAKYQDSYQENLRNMIDAKAKGQKITAVPRASKAPVVDLMEALKKSLAKPAAAPPRPALRSVPKPAAAPMKKNRKAG